MVAVDDFLNEQRALLHRLEELEETAARLAFTAPQAPLPTDAKARLMARVRADAGQGDDVTPAPFVSAFAQTPRPQAQAREPQTLQSWLGGLNLGWVAAAGAVALLLVVFLNANRLNGQMAQLQEQLAQSERQIAELEQTTTTLQAENISLLQQLQSEEPSLAVLARSERSISITGTEEAPGAGGTFFVGQGAGVLVLHGLEPLPDDQSYQLWLLGDGDPVSAGLLGEGQVAPDWTRVTLSAEAGEFAGVAVSIEPSGGSPAPTGPIVLAPPQP